MSTLRTDLIYHLICGVPVTERDLEGAAALGSGHPAGVREEYYSVRLSLNVMLK